MIISAGYDMPEMRNHARRDKHLAVIIEIKAPRITETVRHDFKTILGGMITPDSAVEILRLSHRRFLGKRLSGPIDASTVRRFANARSSGKSLTAIQPAIGAPAQAVQRLVPILDAPPGQAHLDVAIRAVVAVTIRHKKQVRWRAEPQPAHAPRDGGRKR